MFNILNIEIYTFIGGIGVKGSFEGLYTFLEVAEIYGIDDSCLRKQVARGKFVIGEDVKKMGRTWIITEQAMIKSFGALKFEEYKKKRQKKLRPRMLQPRQLRKQPRRIQIQTVMKIPPRNIPVRWKIQNQQYLQRLLKIQVQPKIRPVKILSS